MSDLDKKVNEYVEKFGENVPVFSMPFMSEEDLIALIEKSIQSGNPINLKTSDDPKVKY